MNTYSDLLDAISNWPDLQGETGLESIAPTLVSLAEVEINGDSNLRLQRSLVTLVVTEEAPVEGYTLPEDCLQVDYVADADGVVLDAATVELLDRADYAVDGMSLVFSVERSEFVIRYYQRPPALSTVGSHWLFAYAPDLYLYGSLVQAGVFTKESDQEMSRYAAKYAQVIERLRLDDWTTRFPYGSSLQVRTT